MSPYVEMSLVVDVTEGKNNSKDKENNITYWNKICQADDTSQKRVAALNRQYVVADILGPQ